MAKETPEPLPMEKLLCFLPDILRDLVTNDIPFSFKKDGIIVEGFYKSSSVKLIPVFYPENWDPNVSFLHIHLISHWEAISRYGEKDTIHTFNDLLSLNYSWWERSYNRIPDGWPIDEKWKPHLVKAGYVKEIVKCAPNPKLT